MRSLSSTRRVTVFLVSVALCSGLVSPVSAVEKIERVMRLKASDIDVAPGASFLATLITDVLEPRFLERHLGGQEGSDVLDIPTRVGMSRGVQVGGAGGPPTGLEADGTQVGSEGLTADDGTQVGSEGLTGGQEGQEFRTGIRVWGDPHVKLMEQLELTHHGLSSRNGSLTETLSADGTRLVRKITHDVEFENWAQVSEGGQQGGGAGAGAEKEEESSSVTARMLVEVSHLDEGFATRFRLRVRVQTRGEIVAADFDYNALRVRRSFRRGWLGASNEEPGLTDAVRIADHLFLGRNPLDCEAAADINADDEVTITDVVEFLGFLFRGGNAPPEPFVQPGYGALESPLACPQLFGAGPSSHAEAPRIGE